MIELFICSSIAVVIIGLIVIFNSWSTIFNIIFHEWEMSSWLSIAPPVLIREEWRAVNYKSDITILDMSTQEANEFMRNYYFQIDPKEVVIQDNAHLDYVIQKQATVLTKQMIRDGCIKIINEPDTWSGHPFRRLIQLHFKIYKPE